MTLKPMRNAPFVALHQCRYAAMVSKAWKTPIDFNKRMHSTSTTIIVYARHHDDQHQTNSQYGKNQI